MHRRSLIKLIAASAALNACSKPKKSPKHVAVVGGGIIGASIAYHLSQAGAKVTLLERSALANRASRGTFAWINASWAKQPRHYHHFNQLGVSGWKTLQAALDLPIRWGGSLEWFPTPERQALLTTQIDEQVAWGEPARMVSIDELRQLEPNVRFQDAREAALSPNDGALNPVYTVNRLIEESRKKGAVIVTNCTVASARDELNGQVVLDTDCGSFSVNKLVLATGADSTTAQTIGGIDIPQRSTPGVIVITKPMPSLLSRIIVAPGVHIHQRLDGRIVLGEQDGAPQTETHSARLYERPTRFPSTAIEQQHAGRILKTAAIYVREIEKAEIDQVYIGWRPLPLDGHPVIGPSPARPNVYFAITHSGVTLAPIIGKSVAQEIMHGENISTLEAYRPTRDFSEIQRY